MAITPSQWSHVLTIPESYTPSATTSGQTLVITESVIAKLSPADQNTFWNAVQNGGGDVRICTDSAGTNQLPVEIVSLDNVAQTFVIWTRKPTYNGTGNLYLFIGKAGETQPAVTDPFGRNAVWVDFDAVYHFDTLNKLVDSSGNADLTEFGTLTSVAAKVGEGIDSGGDYNNRAESASYKGVTGSSDRTVSFWSSAPVGVDSGVVSWGGVGGGKRWSVRFQDGTLRTEVEGSFKRSNSATSNDSYIRYASIYSGGSFPGGLKHRVNGADEPAYTQGGSQSIDTVADNNLIVNGFDNFKGGGDSAGGHRLDELSIRAFAVSDAQESAEYANQNDPATFFGVPTLEEAVKGVSVTADAAFTISVPSVSASASVTLPQPRADVNFTLNTPVFAASADATLPQPSASIAHSINAPTFTADATVTLPNPTADVSYMVAAPTFSVDSTVTLPQPTANTAFSLPTPTFSADASVTLPQPIADGNFTITAPTFSVVAIVGGIAIIVEDETNINTTTLSNNLTVPPLSNNIDL